MRRSRAPSNWPGPFFAARSSAGCTINMFGFDLRQAQASSPSAAILRDLLQRGSHAPFGQQGRAVAANSTCRWSHFAQAISWRTSSSVCACLISDRHRSANGITGSPAAPCSARTLCQLPAMPETERAMAVIRDFIQHRLNDIVQRLRSDCVCFRFACGTFRT